MKQDRYDIIRQITTDIKHKLYKPVYLLHGAEEYFIDELCKYMEEHILTESERAFNMTVMYARDTTPAQIAETARRFPMMAEHQLVIVKELQGLKENKVNWEPLEAYCANPLPTTVLCLCYKHGTYDKRKKMYKDIDKKGMIFESDALRENEMFPWLLNYVKRKEYTVSDKAAQLLIDHVGTDLSKAVNELSKLFINLAPGGAITPELIEKNIGISKDFNVFELQKAIAQRNHLKAQQIALHFASNPKANSIHKVIPILYSYFAKLALVPATQGKNNNEAASVIGVSPMFIPEYRQASLIYNGGTLQKAFDVLHEFDLKSKGIGSLVQEEGSMMQEMLYKIMH